MERLPYAQSTIALLIDGVAEYLADPGREIAADVPVVAKAMELGALRHAQGFDEYELGPGMAISFDASAPHRLWAIGDEPAEAIWIVVGRQNDGRGPAI